MLDSKAFPKNYVKLMRREEGFTMFKKVGRVLLPLGLLAVIAATTIASTCCSPGMTTPPFTVGGIPFPSMWLPPICF
jgi:hypothetical protein